MEQTKRTHRRVAPAAPVSDWDRLADEVKGALEMTGYPPLRDLVVLEHEGLVVLRGMVPSYHLKQMAQTAVLSVPGIDEVRNELEVVCRQM